MPIRPIRVLLVIRQTLLRECLSARLAVDPGLAVLPLATPEEALHAVASNPEGVVVVDLEGPATPGPAFAAAIRAGGFSGGILGLASGTNFRVFEQWLTKGGSGIFLKHDSVLRLLDRIYGLANGETVLDEASLMM